MNELHSTRRELLARGGSAAVGLALLHAPGLALAFPARAGEELVPWLDPPPEPPPPFANSNLLRWPELDSWITPTAKFFRIEHYKVPEIDPARWRLEVGGRVRKPRSFTLAQLKAMPRKEVTFTLECSGNRGFPWFTGGIGTARFAGVPLANVLGEVGLADDGRELVFWGADRGQEEVRGTTMEQSFARAMAPEDALHPDNILCYEMNGRPLPVAHGAPLRLIAPNWYGIANVKWLVRIEAINTRYMGRFMARDYVSVRKERGNGESRWTEKSVGRRRINSYPAKVTRVGRAYRIQGAAWGAPIAKVEVSIDGGPWSEASVDRSQQATYAWSFWHLDWNDPPPGEHTVRSRAIDRQGNVQPAPDDAIVADKITYWESNGQATRRVRTG